MRPKPLIYASLGLLAVLLILAAVLLYLTPRAVPTPAFTRTTTFAGTGGEIGEPFGIALRNGETYVSDGENGKIWKIAADGKQAVFADGFDTPSGIAFAGDDLIVADAGRHAIKKVTPDGTVSLIAGVEGNAGNTDGPAAAAQFNAPVGVAAGDNGRIYVSDTYNDRIRVIEDGRVTTLAGGTRGLADGSGVQARFDTPTGLAIWNGHLLVADTGNRRIRVVESDGSTWTLAGDGRDELRDGLLSTASFVSPSAITVSTHGVIYVADDNAIRLIGGHALPLVTTITAESRGLRDGDVRRSRFNRPSGLAVDASGGLLVADSENRLVRRISADANGLEITPEQIALLTDKSEQFRTRAPARWPYDPPEAKRDIAGTLGELRGEVKPGNDDIHFHNGLDIAGSYGETTRFVRDEKVLRPVAVENFGTLRELVRLPTLGYIHIRLGRNAANVPFGDPRFQYSRDDGGNITDVRIPRGAKFRAGEPIGTLNPMNHVHLIAGRSGSEMNALDALVLPGISDSRPPVIEKVTLADENWRELETKSPSGRIELPSRTRVIVRAYDQVDGNAERRRLGVFKVGYQFLHRDGTPVGEIAWTIRFDRLPDSHAVRFVYADGSKSGATGETIFNYIATNRVDGSVFKEDYLDTSALDAGEYVLRVFAGDYFGNKSYRDIAIEVKK